MAIVNLLINIGILLGVWIMFYYQRSKISSLKTTIDSQKDILDSTQKFISIFNLDQVKKYVKLREDTFEMEMEKQIQVAEDKINKLKMGHELITSEFVQSAAKCYGAAFVMLLSIRPEDRETVIERISDQRIKTQLKEMNDQYRNDYNPPNPLYLVLSDLLLTSGGDLANTYKKISSNNKKDSNEPDSIK